MSRRRRDSRSLGFAARRVRRVHPTWLAVFAGLVGFVALGGRARADQVIIGPAADNSMFEEGSGLSNGAGAHLFAGRNDDGFVRRGLLRFDVAGALPAGSTVTDVELHLYCDRTKSQDEVVALHRVTEAWGEGGSDAAGEEGKGAMASLGSVTWADGFFGSVAWSVPGGAFAAGTSASTVVRGANQYYVWSGAGLAADVQAWLDAPSSNHGWLLRGNEAAVKVTKRFASRDNVDLTLRPYLVITFTLPATTTGACCSAMGGCTVVTAATAGSCVGAYQGDGTSCAPNPCPPPNGACCLPDPMATCVSVSEASCTTQGGRFNGALSACAPNPCPVVLAPYVDPLPLPAVAQPVTGVPSDTATYQMAIRETWQQLHRDLPPTRVWGYDDGQGPSYPGPTLETRTDRPITVTWRNDLRGTDGQLRSSHILPVDLCPHGAADDAQTVVHLHGGHVPPEADGYPESTFLPGAEAVYEYPNNQPAGSLWYHDHALGVTRLNVYMGLAGLYVVRDAVDDALGLPSGAYEVPLVIQDRKFNPDGSLAYPEMFMEHFFGDTVLVNGKVWPYLDVARGKYRFRVYDGSNSRSYHLAFSNGMAFHVIGGDGGLLEAPILTNDLTLTPGERAEIIVDFSSLAPGTEVELVNDASAPFPGVPGENSIREVMLFRVGSATGHTAPLPASLRMSVALDPAEARVERTFELDKTSDPCTGSMWMINGLGWHDITERPVLGSSEVWTFVNRSGMSHPMHMHLVFFQVLDKHAFTLVGGVPTPTGAPLPLLPTETGWKDTVQVPPGQMVRVIARFEDYLGRYAYHCHILEHEDHEMMRQFETTMACGDGVLSAPYEACDDGNLADGDGCEASCLGTCDVVGACDDANACTTDTCDPATGCAHASVVCSDGEECTSDACDPVLGCVFSAATDGTPCSLGACLNGVCVPPAVDAGVDAGSDAGTDAGSDSGMDAGSDSGTDSGMDAGLDAGSDAGTDASVVDAGLDAGVDAAMPDAGTPQRSDGGCGCRIVAEPARAPGSAWPAALSAAAFGLAFARRRRMRRAA